MAKPAPVKSAKQWFEAAVRTHDEAQGLMHSAKGRAILAGWMFLQAKLATPHGEWNDVIETYSDRISRRTVFAYVAFATDAIVSVVAAERQLTDAQVRTYEPTEDELRDPKLLEAAKEIVIHSTVGFVDLARQLSLFRQFGSYDAVQQAAAKARHVKATGEQQMVFDFTIAKAALRTFAALDKVDAESLPADQLDELEASLTAALEKVRERRRTITVETVEEGGAR